MEIKKEEICSWLLIAIVVTILLCLMHSCTTTKYIPVKEVHTDTIYKARKDSIILVTVRNVIDSVIKMDSVVLRSDGSKDTWHWSDHISIARDSTSYYKALSDSLKNSKVDSIPKPYPVNKYIEKNLSWWQKTVMGFGYTLLISILLIALYYVIRNKVKVLGAIKKILKI